MTRQPDRMTDSLGNPVAIGAVLRRGDMRFRVTSLTRTGCRAALMLADGTEGVRDSYWIAPEYCAVETPAKAETWRDRPPLL
jgi:hypothetical protein